MKKIFIFILILFIMSCSLIQKPQIHNKEIIINKLLEQLNNYNQFKAIGLSKIFMKNFELKANFVIWKKGDQFELDLLEGGILGLRPTPKAQIVNNVKSFLFYLPDNKKIYHLPPIKFNSNNFEDMLKNCEISNIENGMYNVFLKSGFKLKINKNLMINEISYDIIKLEISDYNNKIPGKINIFYHKQKIAEFIFEKWYNKKTIKAKFFLQIPQSVDFEEIKWKELLKKFQ